MSQAEKLLQQPAHSNVDAIERAIAERLAACQAQDFARADAIRARLMQDGIVLEDEPAGTAWRHGSGDEK